MSKCFSGWPTRLLRPGDPLNDSGTTLRSRSVRSGAYLGALGENALLWYLMSQRYSCEAWKTWGRRGTEEV